MNGATIRVLECECSHLWNTLADYKTGKLDVEDVRATLHTVALSITRCRELLAEEEAQHGE